MDDLHIQGTPDTQPKFAKIFEKARERAIYVGHCHCNTLISLGLDDKNKCSTDKMQKNKAPYNHLILHHISNQ